jgi:hypothetical protein
MYNQTMRKSEGGEKSKRKNQCNNQRMVGRGSEIFAVVYESEYGGKCCGDGNKYSKNATVERRKRKGVLAYLY